MQELIGILYSFNFFLLLVCAAAYYKLADLDPDASSILWVGLSVGVFLLTWLVLGWGVIGNLIGQLSIFGGITIVRGLRSRGGPS